jgi:MerR family transcriptional regulator, thiopeptide resistance regulator
MPSYSIGEVARRSGLTVRALRHYDALGLLRPSHRTGAGHRRYSAADVARLRRLTSLRALGLPLDRIGALLDDPAADPVAELDAQAARVRAEIARGEALLERLRGLATVLRNGHTAAPDDLFHLIHLTVMYEQYYTPEQLAAIKARGEALGPEGMQQAQQAWADLIARAQAAVAAGMAPDAPEAQAIAREWVALVRGFTGGDAGTTENLKRLHAENPEVSRQWGPAPEVMAFVDRAMAAAGVSLP